MVLRISKVFLSSSGIEKVMTTYEVKSGDLETDVEIEGSVTVKKVGEAIDPELEGIDNLSQLTSIKESGNSEAERILLPTPAILDELGKLKKDPIEVKGVNMTSKRVEILLYILEENKWLNPADVYRALEIQITKKGVREAIKNMEPFLEIDQYESGKGKLWYRIRPKQNQSTFTALMNLFIQIKDDWGTVEEFHRFIETGYFTDNERQIRQYEEELEEKMEKLRSETASLIEDSSEKDAEMPQDDYIGKLKLIEMYWNGMFSYWLSIEDICENCRLEEECMKTKIKEYGDKISPDQLKLYKKQGKPGRIMATYCATLANSIRVMAGDLWHRKLELPRNSLIYKENIDDLL